MSYLTLSSGIPGFSKVVISFWFRVPKSTLDAVKANFKDDGTSPPFNGITPLLVFGVDSVNSYNLLEPLTASIPTRIEQWTQTDPDTGVGSHSFLIQPDPIVSSWNSFGLEPDTSSPIPKEPCYIGIDCNTTKTLGWDGETTKPNALRINLQFSNVGSGSGMGWTTSATGSSLGVSYGFTPGSIPTTTATVAAMAYVWPLPAGSVNVIADYNPYESTTTYSDASHVAFKAATEQCIIKPNTEVTPDQWHHILLSCDMTGPISAIGRQYAGYDENLIPIDPGGKGRITTPCRIWLAYDDHNISGVGLLGGSFDPDKTTTPGNNDLFTQNAANTASQLGDVDHTQGPILAGFGGPYLRTNTVVGLTNPSYDYQPGHIESAGFPIGIPASEKYVNNVCHVEMAELQMFTDVTLDTNVEKNRRAFISKDGKPVSASQKKQKDEISGKTTGDSGSIELLGKRPDVLLHGSGNWIHGSNTGSTGIDKDGKKLLGGQFKPTAKIETYVPEPSLHGPQKDEKQTADEAKKKATG